MATDENIPVEAKLIEQDICEAVGSTWEVTATEEGEDGNEECVPVRPKL